MDGKCIMDFIDVGKCQDLTDAEDIIIKLREDRIKCGDNVELMGYIHRIRKMQGFEFIIIRTPKRLVQCIYNPEFSKNPGVNSDLKEESCVKVSGKLIKDERSKLGFEIQIHDIQTLSHPFEPLPITVNKKALNCNIDVNLDYRPISLRNPAERAILRIVAGVLREFRNFMISDGFTEFVSPKIVSAGAEGGANMFEVDYFEQKAYLNQSPQIYKQMMVGVFNKVFTISPVFRAEKHNTSRHINEFEGLDVEMGFINSHQDLMALEARFLIQLYDVLNEEFAEELEEIKVTLPDKIDRVPKVRFTEIKEIVSEKYKRKFRNDYDLEPEEERLIGKYFLEEFNCNLVFITHYPSKKRPFYAMDDPQDSNLTLSFDLLLNGTEVTTGGQRIHDYQRLVDKMNSRNMSIEDFENYLMIFKYGMPPHGGFGIGLERLVMNILNIQNIRRVTAFPRDITRLNP